MYHPSRGGVRGGRDQFKWDDVKVDKHRENYVGHSIMAPVGRWQKGKDLNWYARDKKAAASDAEAAKEEIRRIKEEEERAMREALGLAPKRAVRPQGNRLDKHEYSELVKRGSTAEDLGAGHAEAAQVQGVGLYKGHKSWAQSNPFPEEASDAPSAVLDNALPAIPDTQPAQLAEEAPEVDDQEARKKRRREEKRHEKERRHEGREKKRSRDYSKGKEGRHRRDRGRHDSGSD